LRIFIPAISVLILDQFTKIWVKNTFTLYDSKNIIGDFLRISYVENPGIAFGIRVGNLSILITAISLAIAIYIVYYLFTNRDIPSLERIGLSLILGGAIGNLIDRILVLIPNSTYNGVIDFIDMGFNNHRWYIFNIADSAVTVGITLYLFHSILFDAKVTDFTEHD